MIARRRKLLFKYILPLSIVTIIIFSGVVDINIINTKNLSPLGNTNENYQTVSNEFGKDFTEFIKDNSNIKIYTNDDEVIVIKVNGNSFNIKNSKAIKKDINEETNYIKNKFYEIKEKISKILW